MDVVVGVVLVVVVLRGSVNMKSFSHALIDFASRTRDLLGRGLFCATWTIY